MSYDSPTFLGRKDKYLMGLSLPQLMILIGVGFTGFVFTLLLPVGMMMRFAILAPATGVAGILFFGRIAGLSIPMYFLKALSYMFSKPVYEEHKFLLLNGAPVWLEAQQQPRGLMRFLRRGRRPADSLEMQDKAAQMRAEFDSKVVEGSVATEQFVRDAARTLLRGS